MHAFEPALALGGLGRLPRQGLPAAVDVGAGTARIGYPDGERCVLGHIAKAYLALPECRLSELAIGDVDVDPQIAEDTAVIAHRDDQPVHEPRGAGSRLDTLAAHDLARQRTPTFLLP